MGKYINETSNGQVGASFDEKVEALKIDGAIAIKTPLIFSKDLVCVVDNGYFGAAAYAYDEKQMNRFKRNDGRIKQWLVWDKVKQYID